MNGNLQTNTCDADRLESYLNGELSEMQELEFTAHLDQCEACRSSLELRAADPESWSEAEQLLKPLRLGAEHLVPPRSQAPQIQQVLDALAPTDDPAMLGRLGGYEVSGVVGAGGMGVVLKAVDKSLDRTVAIKVMSPHLATSGGARKRFAREAKAAAAVLHPNVIAIHSVSNDETLPYLVMPYIRGASLQKRLDAEGPLALNEILRIGSQIAAGLSAAHAQGLVHRDIKPANILLEDGIERVAITDFGLARAVDDATITRSGVIAGTPQYMSPEQARGESIDQRSDLFSLGSVMYAICTGRPPFRAETTFGVMRRITDDEPKSIREINPDIPDWLCVIVKRLMSKRVADRFESAEEVQELLEQCLAHVQQPTVVPLPESLVTQPKARRFFRIKTAIVALGIVLLAFLLWQTTSPPDISGKWTGSGWGQVTLEQIGKGKYTGTYIDTYGKDEGTIELKWSLVDQGFRGTWGEGRKRTGRISIELVNDEIHGNWTVSKKSEINPGSPAVEKLVWKRGIPDAPATPRGEDHRLSLEEFERLIETRRYKDAESLARIAQELAREASIIKTWELRSKFARQLRVADVNSPAEQELRELLKFPLQMTLDHNETHAVSPPSPAEVIRVLEERKNLAEGELTDLFKQHRDNIRIVVETVYDKVDPPRFFPLIGTASLHRVRFKCTVYFTETDELKWPVPHEAKKEIKEIINIDLDHLHVYDAKTDSGKETSLKLNFFNAPYTEAIKLLAIQLDVPVQFDVEPSGTFSYKDENPVPASKVIEILNIDLAKQGLKIVRQPGRLLVRAIESNQLKTNSLQGTWEYLSYERNGVVKQYKPGTATLSIVGNRWTVGPGLGERVSHRVEIEGDKLTFHGKTSSSSFSGDGGNEPSLAYGRLELKGDSLVYLLSPFSLERDVLERNTVPYPSNFDTNFNQEGTDYTVYRLLRKESSSVPESSKSQIDSTVPIYGERNPQTGERELNSAWANALELGPRVPAESSSRNPPTKLPDGLTKEARYCLLKLGDQKQTDIWLIQDRDWLYVDLNGDGDLSSPDERFVEKEEQGFSIPEITSRGYVIPPSLQSDPEVRGYFPLRLSWQKTGEQNLWVRLFVEKKYWQESIISASATKPELAPILHFDGPLRYFLLHPTSRFTVGATPLSMAVAIGTVSETGDITYVDLDEPPLEGKVISDLTVRYYAADDSEPREIETNGLTPDGYGGYLISTLKTTDDMQSGKIEIEVRSPEDSRLPVAPLKSRIPLVKSKAALTDSSP